MTYTHEEGSPRRGTSAPPQHRRRGTSQPGHVTRATLQDCDRGGSFRTAKAAEVSESRSLCLQPGQGWRQPETRTSAGSPPAPSVLCWHIFLQERNTGQHLLLLLVTAFNCKKNSPLLTSAEIRLLLCLPNPGCFQGAREQTPEQRPGSLEHLHSPPNNWCAQAIQMKHSNIKQYS